MTGQPNELRPTRMIHATKIQPLLMTSSILKRYQYLKVVRSPSLWADPIIRTIVYWNRLTPWFRGQDWSLMELKCLHSSRYWLERNDKVQKVAKGKTHQTPDDFDRLEVVSIYQNCIVLSLVIYLVRAIVLMHIPRTFSPELGELCVWRNPISTCSLLKYHPNHPCDGKTMKDWPKFLYETCLWSTMT